MPGACCYPKAARLRRRAEFLALQRNGRRKQLANFVVIRRDEDSPGRLGVTVSSKVGNAVQRNHVKRRVRETFRRVPSSRRASGAFVVIAKAGARFLTQQQMAAEIGELFSADV